ncbi:MAG TPA: anti-sigma factor [Solirubrobacterales bacterium]
MNGEHPDRDDLVAFALGALDPGGAREVEAHAPSCARCTRQLEALVPAVGVLGESVEQLEPPPKLRERVLAEVRSDVARPAEEPETPRHPSRRGWRGLFARPAIAVGLAIVAAAVGGYLLAGNGDNGAPEEPSVPVVAQQGIGGTLAIGERSSMLDLHGLAQLRGREVYQVWVAQGQSVRPSSNFIPDSHGRAMTAIDGRLSPGAKVMVTREPHPGERAPTTPVLLSATVE